MAIQLPYVELAETFTEWLDLLADPKKLTERGKQLQGVLDAINSRLKTAEAYGDVQAHKNRADLRMSEAIEKENQANAFHKEQTEKANKLFEAAVKRRQETEQVYNSVKEALDEREQKLLLLKEDLEKREQAAAKDLLEAVKLNESANRTLVAAESIKKEYEAKEAKLKTALG